MSPATSAWLFGTLFWAVGGMEARTGKRAQAIFSWVVSAVCFAIAGMEWLK